MIASLPVFATLLFALSQIRAEDIPDEIIFFKGNECGRPVTVSKTISGSGGDGWIDFPPKIGSFETSQMYGEPSCLFMMKEWHGCQYTTMELGEIAACGVMPPGDWKSAWVRPGHCPEEKLDFACVE